jgi:hypothetical protein
MTTNNVFAWSGTAGSNADVAGNGITGPSNISLGNDVFQNIMAQITNGMITRGSDIATASTVDFTAATTPSLLHDLTGTTTVTAVTMTAGWWRLCRAQGAFQLTASSTLVVNGSTSTNYTTTAGDLLIFFGYSASTVRVWTFTGGAGLPLTGGTLTGNLTISKSGPLLDLKASASGQSAGIEMLTGSNLRWQVLKGFGSESGANAGSDFTLSAYDDSGSFLGNYLVVTRSSGAVTLSRSLSTSGATGGDKGADTINATTYYKGGNYGVVTLGTPVASTAGTAIDFTGIPAGVRRLSVHFNGVSLSGTAHLLIQIGDSGGIETTGYVSSSSSAGGTNAVASTQSTAGFVIYDGTAANAVNGSVILSLVDGSATWAAFGSMSVGTGFVSGTGGTKALSPGPLDRVRITTTNGTDTFDAGEINISYE